MDSTVTKRGYGFASYPSVFLYEEAKDKSGTATLKKLKQLIFGDYIKIIHNNKGKPITKTDPDGTVFVKARARQCDGYIRSDDVLPDRILEVNFVDIGQGDGCHVVTPDDEHFLIDAGQSDNMYRFLKWRFNLKKASIPPPPFTVVISHSDADHYAGFAKIFTRSNDTQQQFKIKKVYHNGMVEKSGSNVDSLGTLTPDKRFITDLCDTQTDFAKRSKEKGAGTYIKTLLMTTAAKNSLRAGKKRVLYKKGKLTMEVLGPVAQKVGGKDALPVFKDKGKTKNGHSVIINLSMGKFKVFLGGDLNTESEEYLMTIYGQKNIAAFRKVLADKKSTDAEKKKAESELQKAVMNARSVFQCDVAKSCHHGSSDFTTEFLSALNPMATVISSGDDEPHCHPRPDTLGTIGKYCRGERSLIFSTELTRSGKEFIDLKKLVPGMTKVRAVTRYGMINLRTDGNRAIIAQKLERPAPRGDWDIHEFVWDKTLGEFVYKRKH